MPESSHIALKVVVIVHFVLSVLASMNFLNFNSYIYMNAFILAFGVWAIISQESIDAIHMFLILNVISIGMDVMFLGMFSSQAERAALNADRIDSQRFSFGIAILNLLLKPFSSYILLRLYQDRRGEVLFPAFKAADNSHRGGYESIGQPPTASNYVETTAPYATIAKQTPQPTS